MGFSGFAGGGCVGCSIEEKNYDYSAKILISEILPNTESGDIKN